MAASPSTAAAQFQENWIQPWLRATQVSQPTRLERRTPLFLRLIFLFQQFPLGFCWFSRKIRIPGFRMEMKGTPRVVFFWRAEAGVSPPEVDFSPFFFLGLVLGHRFFVLFCFCLWAFR